MLGKWIGHVFNAVRNIGFHKTGRCTICGNIFLFYAFDSNNPKEMLMCFTCRSVSRQRLLARHLLNLQGLGNTDSIKAATLDLSHLKVLDSAGKGSLSRFAGNSNNWVKGYFSTDRSQPAPEGLTFVDLQHIDFPDNHFDVVISEDVLEHIPEPKKALAEISRVLRPGGFHLFTIPYNNSQKTFTRAEIIDGELIQHAPSAYHWDPESASKCFVFTDFGENLSDWVEQEGMTLEIMDNEALRHRHLLGNRPVFLARKK